MFDSLKKMFEKNAKTISLKAVEDGRTIPMDEVNDQTFAQELLGPGIAIAVSYTHLDVYKRQQSYC